MQRPSLVNRPWQQTVLMYRVPSSHVICIVTCGGDRKEPSIEKVETGLEYSSGKGPGFDPLAPRKQKRPGEEGRLREGRGLFCNYTEIGRWLKLGLNPHLWGCTRASFQHARTLDHELPAVPFLDPSLTDHSGRLSSRKPGSKIGERTENPGLLGWKEVHGLRQTAGESQAKTKALLFCVQGE